MIEETIVQEYTFFLQITVNCIFILILVVYVYIHQDWAKVANENEGENLGEDIKEEAHDQAGGTIIYRDGAQTQSKEDSVLEHLLQQDNTILPRRQQRLPADFGLDLSAIPQNQTEIRGGNASFLPMGNLTMGLRAHLFDHQDRQGQIKDQGEEGKIEDNQQENMLGQARPKSWKECLIMLWKIDEKNEFRITNPDGYFYLLFLKMSGLFFFIISVFSFVIIPLIYDTNDRSFDEQSIVNRLVFKLTDQAVLFMYFYVFLAYITIYKFSKSMASFEFSSQVEYHDRYVARHAVIIRGVNRNIGTIEVAKKIGRLFEQRFKKDQVLSCNSYRQSKQANKLHRKMKHYQKKLQDIRQQNELTGESGMVWVGERLKCNRKQVKRIDYYEEKLKKAVKAWEDAKSDSQLRNEGIVILVFRSTECVHEAIEEIDLLKESLASTPQFDRLNVMEWEMKPGIPSQDILWPNVSKLLKVERMQRFKAFAKPLSISMIIISLLLLLEKMLEIYAHHIAPLLLQATVTGISLFHICGTPYFVFQALLAEQHWLKSARESLYTLRLFIIQFTNVIVVPMIFSYIFNDFGQTSNTGWMPTLQSVQSIVVRQSLQIIVLIVYFQVTIKSETVVKAINCQLKVNGKYKFSHFQHDLGLRCCLVVVFWCLGITNTLLTPIISPIMAIIFLLLHFLDKFNISFVYPMDFESQMTNRKTLVKGSLVGIIFFQIVMLLYLKHEMTFGLISIVFALLLVQAFGLIFMFRFIRKPWQGIRQKDEEVDQIEQEKLFESISSYQNDFTQRDFEGTVMGQRLQEKVTANQKAVMLREAYRDPFDLQFVKIEAKEKSEKKRVYTSPNTPPPPRDIEVVTVEPTHPNFEFNFMPDQLAQLSSQPQPALQRRLSVNIDQLKVQITELDLSQIIESKQDQESEDQ